ncbi:mannose-binding protein-like [Rhinatrema bivittatum]|uniref:mannose-binding protein-like n=1 Tax=Rhinatrema bivittatum TaxID=194408 RepID=UPI00112EC054|nr:mannose-binding protein-like [Rhinatrema bivittatum]XP_029465328.1 mannose-binding protein-like [Rhinatrema bivittatum]
MHFVQVFNIITMGIFLVIASNSESSKCEEVTNTCAVLSFGNPGINGLPGRDGRDGKEGQKGEKGDVGLQGMRGLQGPPGKVGPIGPKGAKGPPGEKGQEGKSGVMELDDLKAQFRALEGEIQTLKDNFEKQQKILFFHGGKRIGEKVFVTNGKEENFETAKEKCEQAGGLLAAPKNEAENTAIQEILQKDINQAFLGISDQHVEGMFKYVTGEKLAFSNWNLGEPNNSKDGEDCVEILNNGKWNDIPCSLTRLIICQF